MKALAIITFAAAVQFVPGHLHAANWEAVSLGDKESIFLDAQSVYRDKGTLKAAVLHNYSSINHLGDDVYPHKSRMVVYEIQCATGQLGYAQWSFHGADLATGRTVWTGAVSEVSYFRPDANSAEQKLLGRVCAASGSTALAEPVDSAQ